MPTPEQKLIHNPIPTSSFLSDMCLLLVEDITGTIINSFVTKILFTQTNKERRCRDGVMNEFLFWCRHPFFMKCDIPIHPLHFREMLFPLRIITEDAE